MAYNEVARKTSNNILKLTLSDEEYEYIKQRPRGYVRDLIKTDMGGGGKSIPKVEPKPSEKNIAVKIEDPMPQVYVGMEKHILAEAAQKRAMNNPHACRECGKIKSAGRCINGACKLKGKLQ